MVMVLFLRKFTTETFLYLTARVDIKVDNEFN